MQFFLDVANLCSLGRSDHSVIICGLGDHADGSSSISHQPILKSWNHTTLEKSEKISVMGKYVCRSSAKFEMAISYRFENMN